MSINRIWEVVNDFNASAVVITVMENGDLYIKGTDSMGELPNEGAEMVPESKEELVVAVREACAMARTLQVKDVARIEVNRKKVKR